MENLFKKSFCNKYPKIQNMGKLQTIITYNVAFKNF